VMPFPPHDSRLATYDLRLAFPRFSGHTEEFQL
jgi:hypothetical protein